MDSYMSTHMCANGPLLWQEQAPSPQRVHVDGLCRHVCKPGWRACGSCCSKAIASSLQFMTIAASDMPSAIAWCTRNTMHVRLAPSYLCVDMRIDMCIDMRIDMCIDMRIDMRTYMCRDKCIAMMFSWHPQTCV